MPPNIVGALFHGHQKGIRDPERLPFITEHKSTLDNAGKHFTLPSQREIDEKILESGGHSLYKYIQYTKLEVYNHISFSWCPHSFQVFL